MPAGVLQKRAGAACRTVGGCPQGRSREARVFGKGADAAEDRLGRRSDSRYTCTVTDASDPTLPWLLLVHQLPPEPSRVRVKVWRRLQGVGAVAIRNSVYALPHNRETREDFEWIRGEIVAQGGEATVFLARVDDKASEAQMREAFDHARQSDWRDLSEKCRKSLKMGSASEDREEKAGELRRQAAILRGQAERIDKVDYFGAPGRREALADIARLERLIAEDREAPRISSKKHIERFRGRVWFTRPRPGVDRMASAWLIRRFIDPEARFRFGDRIPRSAETVPFDMFGAELGHQGDRVTFETILEQFGLSDSALSRIARIVHQLDLRIEDPGDSKAPTVGHLVEGLRSSYDDDAQLLEQGIVLFEALYRSFL